MVCHDSTRLHMSDSAQLGFLGSQSELKLELELELECVFYLSFSVCNRNRVFELT